MKLFVSTFAALALLAAVGQAAPLESKNVAADAKWVVHVDVDAVRDSHVVQKAFETCPLLKNDSGKHFDMIRDKIGVDLRKDLHGITLYGRDTDKTHGVAIVFATVNEKLLLEKAEKATDHKVTKHGEIDIHSWTQKHGAKTHPAAGAFYKPDVLVFAASVEGVAAAIDVLDGKSPGITDPKSPLGGHVYAGTSFLARAIAIPPETRCPVLKQAESFRVALGENDGKSFYRAKLVMKSPEAADQVKAINNGLKAHRHLAVRQRCRRHETRRRAATNGQGQYGPGPLGCLGRRCLDRGGKGRQEGRRAHEEGRRVPVHERRQGRVSIHPARRASARPAASARLARRRPKPRPTARPRRASAPPVASARPARPRLKRKRPRPRTRRRPSLRNDGPRTRSTERQEMTRSRTIAAPGDLYGLVRPANIQLAATVSVVGVPSA